MLCGDILPTGYFAALQALGHPNLGPIMQGQTYPLVLGNLLPRIVGTQQAVARVLPEDRKLTIAVVGLGPVGVVRVICSYLKIFT